MLNKRQRTQEKAEEIRELMKEVALSPGLSWFIVDVQVVKGYLTKVLVRRKLGTTEPGDRGGRAPSS